MESRRAALGRGLWGVSRIEPKRERTHGHGQQCSDCGGCGEGVDGCGRRCKEINGNGKNTIKIAY